ncbi:response regulator [Pelovirga terrestris]|uniref:Response regulator n=1 Tax=Pelovirga terrestris TaxID=2771352 RepID=A0A8J6UHN0_9BACT|nr:response regulator [Pelovirga terrestris]MBD1401698.1 response regulator [Pelovirga terrestris]
MNQILVVDDDQELRTTLVEVLEQEGLQAVAARSADDALERLQLETFDLILLDLVMPGTDGMTAIPLIRRQAPRTRIIIMTAYASVQNAVQSLQQGADDYIVKPFKIDGLMLTVRLNLQKARFCEETEAVDLDKIFNGLANSLRRQTLQLLSRQGQMRFMDLVRALEIEDHTKVNFHLKTLREAGFIDQTSDKLYQLTTNGQRAATCLSYICKSLEASAQARPSIVP